MAMSPFSKKEILELSGINTGMQEMRGCFRGLYGF